MRIIKFRAWDKEKKKFFTPTYEAYKGNLEDLHLSLNGRLHLRTLENPVTDESQFPDRFILMQYTGLKDKNGKEIYEGDILKLNGGAEDMYEAVGFQNGCFVLEASWIEDNTSFPELKYYTLFANLEDNKTFKDCILTEVAGNIYENPKLIKDSK